MRSHPRTRWRRPEASCNKAVPSRTISGEGFDAPPTLERSGSERRGGAVTSLIPMVGI